MTFDWMKHLPEGIRKRIEGRKQLQRVLSNITWLSLDKVLRLGVGFFVGVWVARYLGKNGFGQLNVAQAFAVLFSPLSLLGLDAIAIRDIVSKSEQQDTTVGTTFALKMAGSVCAVFLAVAMVIVLRPGEHIVHLLVLIFAVTFFFQTLDVIDFWFQAHVQSKYVVLARNFAFLCVAGVRVALILLHASLVAFAWAALAEIVLASLGLVYFYARQHQSLWNWKVKYSRAKELLQESWPLFLTGISIAIYMRIDQVMIGYYMNDGEVGIYSVAIKLVEIWYFIPMTIASSVFPALIKARSEDVDSYYRKLQIFYDTVSVIACTIAVVTSVFAGVIISVIYGKEFEGSAQILTVYAWASIPVFLNVASSQHLVVENRTRISLFRTVAGGIANVLLNLLLIPRLGAVGAAIASLISYSISTFFLGFEPDLLRQVRMMSRSLNPLRWLAYLGRLKNN